MFNSKIQQRVSESVSEGAHVQTRVRGVHGTGWVRAYLPAGYTGVGGPGYPRGVTAATVAQTTPLAVQSKGDYGLEQEL